MAIDFSKKGFARKKICDKIGDRTLQAEQKTER